MAHGRHRQVDTRIVEDRIGRRDAEDLAILTRRWSADADTENWRGRCGGALAPAARVPAIGHEHDAGDGPALILVAQATERTLDVAAARRGGERGRRDGRDAFAEAENFDVKLLSEHRHETLGDLARAIDAPAAAGRIFDAHATRGVDEDGNDDAARIVGRIAHDRPHQEHGQRHERHEAQRHERPAPPRRQRPPAVCQPRDESAEQRRRGRAPTREEDSRRTRRPTSSWPAIRSIWRSSGDSRPARDRCLRR